MKTIDASPIKSFFTRTLVRDIHLIDAILDLVDNSIDGYIRNHLQDKRSVKINFTKDKFVIEDNCGGIKKDEIYDHIFRFGKPTKEREKTLGVYGIGLKRAIFKIGTTIHIESDDGVNFFTIKIDKDWLEDENNWKLEFETEAASTGNTLTRITITDIFSHIASEIENTTFENDLINRLKNTYTIFLDNKVIIMVNDKIVGPYDFRFLFDGKDFVPFHKKYNFDSIEVEIYAGYTPVEGNKPHPLGWFVFCNDRLIISNNTLAKTGWSYERKYHYPEDDRFLGLVFFRSNNPILLPWQTTKDDIQEDSRIYRRAQVEMRAVTSRLIEVIRLAGRTKDPSTQETIGKALFEDIPSKSIKDIKEESDEIVPILKGRMSLYPKMTTIQYFEKIELVKKVKKKFGDSYMSNRKVGEKTFEYYIKMEDIRDD
jgi:hypothetical protein